MANKHWAAALAVGFCALWLGAGAATAAATAPTPSVPASPAPTPPAPTWPIDVFNPKPGNDDFILPMPCGGAMAFRRVDTLTAENDWLSDQRFRMGAPDIRHGWSEDLRFGHIVGGFSNGGDPRRRYYLIGKYEVTRTQYESLNAKDCAATLELARNPDGALPTENVGWFDAVDFTRRYSVWLRREAPGALPKEEGAPGYVRLPSDAEWEYAARGGGVVMPSKQADALFPMDGGPEDYIWFEGNCNALTQPIGQLKPNPLGLFDVLGNVSEVVLDPFHPTAPGRLHGDTGGFTVRGGSCLTGGRDLRTANRQEEGLYDGDGERRPPMTGMRLAVGALFGVSQSRIDALNRPVPGSPEDAARGLERRSGDARDAVADTALSERARGLAQQADRPALMDNLNQLASDIAAAERRKAEMAGGAARSAVMSGAVLMRNYRQETDEANRLKEVMGVISPERKPQALAQLDRWNNRARMSGEAYLSLLIEAADSLGPDSLNSQLPRVEAAFGYDGATGIVNMARRFVQQCQRYRTQPPRELTTFLQELLAPL